MDQDSHIDEGRLDLVPMIDCVMLLLMFFILTTRFSHADLAIASLLPTGSGGTPGPAPMEVKKPIAIRLVPAGAQRGEGAAACAGRWSAMTRDGRRPAQAELLIGNREAIAVDGEALRSGDDPSSRVVLDALHRTLAQALAEYEVPGDRAAQRPIAVEVFSGLPWSLTLAVYDAVRAFEAGRGGGAWHGNPDDLRHMREVRFSPRTLPENGAPGQEWARLLQ